MRNRFLFPLLLGMFAMLTSARAMHPLVSDDTGTQDKGNWQLEVNTDRYRYRSNPTVQGATETITYGAVENLDLFISPAMLLSPHAGIGDASVGFKWRIAQTGQVIWGLKSELFLPTGNSDKHFGTGRTNVAPTLLASYSEGPWTILGNFGLATNRYRLAEDQTAYRRTLWRTSGAIIYTIRDEFRIAVDAGAHRNQQNGERRTPAFMLVGVIYSPQRKLDLDAGIKFGVNRAEVQRQVGAGLTLRF